MLLIKQYLNLYRLRIAQGLPLDRSRYLQYDILFQVTHLELHPPYHTLFHFVMIHVPVFAVLFQQGFFENPSGGVDVETINPSAALPATEKNSFCPSIATEATNCGA